VRFVEFRHYEEAAGAHSPESVDSGIRSVAHLVPTYVLGVVRRNRD
jgi:hypothetical protein